MKTTVRYIKCGDGLGRRDKPTYWKGLHSQSQGGWEHTKWLRVGAKMSVFTQPGLNDTRRLTLTPSQDYLRGRGENGPLLGRILMGFKRCTVKLPQDGQHL